MKRSLKTLLDTARLFVLFIGCTFLFYYGLKWLDHHYSSTPKYTQPSDGAVKVVGPVHSLNPKSSHSLETRLFQFLKDGE